MTRTATRVAAAVGATVVMMGLATPALACPNMNSGAQAATVSSDRAKTDPGKSFRSDKHKSSLTLAELQAKLDAKIADRLAWVDAIEAKVSASDRLSDEQKTAFLAHLQAKEDALTALRADIAAATSTDAVKAAVKASDAHLWGWGHGRHHDGNRHHKGGFGDRHHGGFGGDRDQRHGGDGDNDRSSFHGGGHGGFRH